MGGSDHVCWSYDDDAVRRRVAVAFLDEGRRQGARLIHTADAPVESLLADLDGLEGRDELIAAGQLVVAPLGAIYDLRGPIDVARQTAAYQRTVDAALADGFSGVRAVSDGTWFLAEESRLASLRRWEVAADRWIAAGNPVSCLCTIDARRVGAHALRDVLHVHPCVVGEPGDVAFNVFGVADGLAIAGEVDAFASPSLARILADMPDLAGSSVDLAGLTFADHHALGALGKAVGRASGPVTVTGAGPVLRRVWDVLRLPAVRWA